MFLAFLMFRRSLTDAARWMWAAMVLSLGAAGACAASEAPAAALWPGVMVVRVDATNTGQAIFRVHQQLPVDPARPGRLRLLYPRWLPGWHGPYGDVSQIAGLTVRVGGMRLAWQRPADNPFAFDIDVPAGAAAVDVHFQWLGSGSNSPYAAPMTRDLLSIQWPALTLVPAAAAHAGVWVQASVRLPIGWGWGTALRAKAGPGGDVDADGWVQFETESLETLMDSPLYAGAAYRRFELDEPGAVQPVSLHLFSDADAPKAPSNEQLAAHRRLVQQTERMFGWRPWRHYALLLANAKSVAHLALEHGESSENAFDGRYFDDWSAAARRRDDVAHELVHAWNGKARRPFDLWAADLNTPTQNSLLWVYEGLTEYWGTVVAVRAGLITAEQFQRQLVRSAAYLVEVPGRYWRSLQDTTLDPSIASTAERPWADWARGWDYYRESALMIWLDADTLIRERTTNRRSLDDFARVFFAGRSGDKDPQLYNFDDVVKALNAVLPYDWAPWLRERLDRTGAAAVPLDGLTRAGWRIGRADARSALDLAELDPEKPAQSLWYSLGLNLAKDGQVNGVAWGSLAFTLGVSKDDTLIAVQRRTYTAERLDAALVANKGGQQPIELILRRGDTLRTLQLDLRTGPNYPRAERIEEAVDLLAEIARPR
jgi:predicted metalloprotease with PDZ domain